MKTMNNALNCERCEQPGTLYQDTDGAFVDVSCLSRETINRYPEFRASLEGEEGESDDVS